MIDERSDIYSLGVTLYELLTLRPPFDGSNRQELLRQIAFDDPAKPRQLSRSIPIDLETVVLKAIEKNPDDRYGSAQELADDLRAFLEHRPIKARPPSPAARASKWLKRHPTFVVSAIAVMLIATCVSTFAAMMIVRENDAKQEALVEARQAQEETEAVLDFLITDLLRAASPEMYPGKEIKVVDVLEEAERRIDDSLRDRPLIEAKVRQILAVVNHDLAHFEKALEHSTRAMRLREQQLGADHLETLKSAESRALAFWRLGNLIEARKILERVRATRETSLGRTDRRTLQVYNNLALVLDDQGETEAARQLFAQVLEIRRGQPGTPPEKIASSLNNLSTAIDDPDESLELLEESLWYYRRAYSEDHPAILDVKHNLARNLWKKGDSEAAIPIFREVLKTRREVLGDHHPRTLKVISQLAVLLRETDISEARQLFEEALATTKQRFGEDHRETVAAMLDLADLALLENDHLTACPLCEQVVATLRIAQPAEPLRLAGALNQLGRTFKRMGEPEKAVACFLEAFDIRANQISSKDLKNRTEQGGLSTNLGMTYGQMEEYPEARKWFERAIAVLNDVVEHHPSQPNAKDYLATSLSGHALTCRKLGRFREAIVSYSEAIRLASPARQTSLKLSRANARLQAGQHELAVLETREALSDTATAKDHYNGACIFALAATPERADDSAGSQDNQTLHEYPRLAMRSLATARDNGYFDTPKGRTLLDTDTDLDSLRKRSDFQEFVRSVSQDDPLLDTPNEGDRSAGDNAGTVSHDRKQKR